MKIENLRTERLAEPRGIVVAQPEFTWTLCASREGESQTACEVEVDRIEIDGGLTPVWRSGKLSRRIGEEIRYSGAALGSRCDYTWRARFGTAMTGSETGAPGPHSRLVPWRRTGLARAGFAAEARCAGSSRWRRDCGGRALMFRASATTSFSATAKRFGSRPCAILYRV